MNLLICLCLVVMTTVIKDRALTEPPSQAAPVSQQIKPSSETKQQGFVNYLKLYYFSGLIIFHNYFNRLFPRIVPIIMLQNLSYNTSGKNFTKITSVGMGAAKSNEIR